MKFDCDLIIECHLVRISPPRDCLNIWALVINAMIIIVGKMVLYFGMIGRYEK